MPGRPPPRYPPGRLPDPGAAGPRRHGRGVPGRAARAPPPGGPQAAVGAGGHQRGVPRAVPARVGAGGGHRPPNVLPVYDAGETDGVLWIAMRYVDGIDLAALLAREGPLAPEQALALCGQVAGALDAAHARGLVHRDVKPANILLAMEEGAVTQAWLADFGLTRRVGGARRSDRERAGAGHHRLRRPRAGRGWQGGRPGRPVLAGVHAVRVPDRGGAVPARQRARGPVGPRQRPAAAAPRAPPGPPRGAG